MAKTKACIPTFNRATIAQDKAHRLDGCAGSCLLWEIKGSGTTATVASGR